MYRHSHGIVPPNPHGSVYVFLTCDDSLCKSHFFFCCSFLGGGVFSDLTRYCQCSSANSFWCGSNFSKVWIFFFFLDLFIFKHNRVDSDIYAMMYMEHWISPRTLLTSVFTPQDIPNLRIKIANELVFHPKNSGMKQQVFEFKEEVYMFSSSNFGCCPSI